MVAIWLIVVDLRGHVFVGAGFGAAHGLFHGLGNAKIAQLVISQRRNKNILRLNIPMNNIESLAQRKGMTHIFRNSDDSFFGNLVRQRLGKWRKELHLDIDVPSYAILALNILDVVTVHNIRCTIELSHKCVFRNDAL